MKKGKKRCARGIEIDGNGNREEKIENEGRGLIVASR